jgi:hypothetical protein
MVALAIVLLAAQAVAPQKPADLSSDDPRMRLEAIRTVAKEPPSEVKGMWLFDALSDPDPAIVSEALSIWGAYEAGFCDQLQDAITEGNLDGRPVSEPAKSVEEWESRLAKRLLAIGKSSSPKLSSEAVKTLGLLTTFGKGLNDAVLLRVLRVGDPGALKNGFVVALRTLAKENPQAILVLLKGEDPQASMGAIMSLGKEMPPEADDVYRAYFDKGAPALIKAGIAGFSYRDKETRERMIAPFLRRTNNDIRRAAADLCGYENEDWKKIALDRKLPGLTRHLAVEKMSVQDWTPEELSRLHFDVDPLVQAAVATNRFPGLEEVPPNYELLWQRYRSDVPELRAACLEVIVKHAFDLREEALALAFEDKSAMVRKKAAESTLNSAGYASQRVQAYAEGLITDSRFVQVNFDLAENRGLLIECLRSRQDRKAIIAATAILPDGASIALPLLTRLARSTDEDVQDQALGGLVLLTDEGGFHALTTLATPRNVKLFQAAIRWMENDVKSQAIPFLRRFLNDPERKVRIAAKSKLAYLTKRGSEDGGTLQLGRFVN